VVASSRASDQPGRSVLHRLQTSHQLVGDAVVQCVAPVQAAGDESLDHRPGGIHGRASDGLSELTQLIVAAPVDRDDSLLFPFPRRHCLGDFKRMNKIEQISQPTCAPS